MNKFICFFFIKEYEPIIAKERCKMNRCVMCGKEIPDYSYDEICSQCFKSMNQREKEEDVSFSLKKGSVLCIISFIFGVILILLSILIIPITNP